MDSGANQGIRGALVAWYYIISGAIGLIISISAITRSYIDADSAVAWLFLLVQLCAAIFGGVEILRRHKRGYQMLYWVSLSCIPAFGSSLLSYYSALGIGIIPTISFGVGYSGTSFLFKFGYDSELNFLSGVGITTLGINIFAVVLTIYLRSLLKRVGIRAWPLQRNVG